MLTKLTWADIEKKLANVCRMANLSADDADRVEQLTELCRRVGHVEGRREAINEVSEWVEDRQRELSE